MQVAKRSQRTRKGAPILLHGLPAVKGGCLTGVRQIWGRLTGFALTPGGEKQHRSAEDAEERGELQRQKRGVCADARRKTAMIHEEARRKHEVCAVARRRGTAGEHQGKPGRAEASNRKRQISWPASPCWTAQRSRASPSCLLVSFVDRGRLTGIAICASPRACLRFAKARRMRSAQRKRWRRLSANVSPAACAVGQRQPETRPLFESHPV